MQLQQPRVIKLRKRPQRHGSHVVGKWGEPTVYRKEGPGNYEKYFLRFGHQFQIGDIVIATDELDVEYYYVLKERTDDGWWKLEWPD